MFDKTFCPSPWLHMRIDAQGNFRPCRWMDSSKNIYLGNIQNDSLIDYFQKTLAPLRKSLLDGESPEMCGYCHHMEQHKKVSGRQRQLLKIGVSQENFSKTMRSSPMVESFLYSQSQEGVTNLMPQDWQIDLGNYCNSACVFCVPQSSSRLALEYKKLGLINQLPDKSWADDDDLVEKFCDFLSSSSSLAYLHFLGGETLITPSFKKILQRLVDHDMTEVHLGFTTNLTVWPEDVIELLEKFKNLHVGVSIECLHPLNDYVRWPSQIDEVKKTLDRWVELSKNKGWYVQIRATPNCLTLLHVDSLYAYAMEHNIGFETCNFIEKPEEMRINAMPPELMDVAKDKIKSFLNIYQIKQQHQQQIVNTRNPNTINQQVWKDAKSYFNYLENESHHPELLPKLVKFLMMFESNRKNSILDYLPEYEKFFRSSGYH